MHLYFGFFSIPSDFAISKKFLMKRAGPIQRVSLQNLIVNFLRYLPMYTIAMQKSQASGKYIFILAFYQFLAILRFLTNFSKIKVGPIPRVSLQNLIVNFLRYLPMHTIVIQKSQASDIYIFI